MKTLFFLNVKKVLRGPERLIRCCRVLSRTLRKRVSQYSSVMPAKAGIQVFSGFPPEACGNDVTGLWTLYFVVLYLAIQDNTFLRHRLDKCVSLLLHSLHFGWSVNQNVNCGPHVKNFQDLSNPCEKVLFRVLYDHQINVADVVAFVSRKGAEQDDFLRLIC